MSESHVELAGSRRPLATGAKRVRDVDPHSHVEVTIALKAPELPSVAKPAGEPLEPAEFAKRYGASPEDVRKVEETLRGYGLRVEGLSASRLSLTVGGTAAAMEAAFKAGLGIYHSPHQGEYRGREGAIYIPAAISGLVTAVLGLDQRRVARRKASEHKGTKTAGREATAGQGALSPADLESQYAFPTGDAEGQSIAIAEFGSPVQSTVLPPAFFPDDVATFCSQQGRASPAVETIAVNLAPLTLAQLRTLPTQVANIVLDETTEVMMDVEIVAALCGGAKISVYYASFDQKGWVDLLERVIGDNPVALSVSYGLAEDSPDWSSAALQAINDRLHAAAMLGITVCVSAGDDGSGCDMPDTRAHVEFPSSSPFVLAVGGTMLDGSQSEVVWWQSPGRRTGNGHSGATGGGVSAIFDRPTWQPKALQSLNAGSLEGRIVPDVAALAGPPLYELTFLGKSAPNGGTSAAAPLWASLIARMNALLPASKRHRFLAPLLYQADSSGSVRGESGCRDITSGNNASHPQPGRGYEATKGYDAVTGWGVPIGTALVKSL
jgi:kumamolisin